MCLYRNDVTRDRDVSMAKKTHSARIRNFSQSTLFLHRGFKILWDVIIREPRDVPPAHCLGLLNPYRRF